MKYFYFIHLAESGLLKGLPKVLDELIETENVEGLIKKYHIGQIAGKRYASKNPILDPIFVEVLGFLQYLHKTEGYSYRELAGAVTFVTPEHAFIYASDGSVYHRHPDNKDFIQIFPGVEPIRFFSMRDAMNHPFFLFIEQLSRKYSTISFRTLANESGSLMNIWPYKDKIHTLARVQESLPEYTGKFIVHYCRSGSHSIVQAILSFAREFVGNEVMLKRSFGCAGESIRPLVIKKKMNSDTLANVTRDYFSGGSDFSGTVITPFYDIVDEYRIYYIFDKNQAKVYSIKKRTNKMSRRVMLDQPNFRIYRTIPVKWSYAGKDFSESDAPELGKVADRIIKAVGYYTGILEIVRTKDHQIIVMEVNFLGGSLIFLGNDTENMTAYNTDIHRYLFS